MGIVIGDETYFRVAEAAYLSGISKSTLIRWIENGTFKRKILRDRNGWRIFSNSDIQELKKLTSYTRF